MKERLGCSTTCAHKETYTHTHSHLTYQCHPSPSQVGWWHTPKWHVQTHTHTSLTCQLSSTTQSCGLLMPTKVAHTLSLTPDLPNAIHHTVLWVGDTGKSGPHTNTPDLPNAIHNAVMWVADADKDHTHTYTHTHTLSHIWPTKCHPPRSPVGWWHRRKWRPQTDPDLLNAIHNTVLWVSNADEGGTPTHLTYLPSTPQSHGLVTLTS